MRKVLIIAEAGVNHNGSLDLAKQLVEVAHEAGADIIKFQTCFPELLVSEAGQKADYQVENTGIEEESQIEMIRKINLPPEDFAELRAHCDAVGIKFLSTAFDMRSLEMLNDMGIDIFKIPSGEITNLPYIKRIGEIGKEVILSTGMANMDDIGAALAVLDVTGLSRDKITVLHCTTDYPTAMADVNLKAMRTIMDEFGVRGGYSDHTLGTEVPIAASALGASVIEKHFTLDRTMEGPDHAASLEPDELSAMVRGIRNIEAAMSGNGMKIPTERESKNIPIARRSIHLVDDIKVGTVLTADHFLMLRPGDGISPMDMDQCIGKTLNADLPKHHKLTFEDLG